MNKYSGLHDMEIAKYYATRGKLTNLDASCYASYTALTYASRKGHLDIVEALHAAGADKKANSYGYTPLICAAQNGRVDCLKFLLSTGADNFTHYFRTDRTT